ncbi:hypothetical protein [Bacteroidetes bacterium endosymbiont of Geopemphigus sp.]|uniref:hypothetical protein n=1 Tax=Bacteroidetes bacterium endosymbiont of Geopemphigus sp. TaxID=2047937 RepID=UPI000CD25A07|nr:hypothetical protein [Bacteroidetes bacterium endosymbiont of Geopemphigus sp.]
MLELPVHSAPMKIPIIDKIRQFSSDELERFYKVHCFVMSYEDLSFIQNYFQQQRRDPFETELRVFDTYWSDHCRHTSFITCLKNIAFEGIFQETLQNIFQNYQNTQALLKREEKPVTLMDLVIITSKTLRAEGYLERLGYF